MKYKLFTILCILGVHCGVSAKAAVKPNFIVIHADNFCYGDLDCYGEKDIATTRIWQMSREGAKFTLCYVAPVCSPSCASLVTGCIAQRVGMGGVLFPRNNHGLKSEETELHSKKKISITPRRGYDLPAMRYVEKELGKRPPLLPNRERE